MPPTAVDAAAKAAPLTIQPTRPLRGPLNRGLVARSVALCVALALPLITAPAQAQTGALGGTLGGNLSGASNSASPNTQDAWRATSRLGYGPSPATAQAALADPRAWARQQIDAAFDASQRVPVIPPELARFNEPIGKIATDFAAEREARRLARQQLIGLTAAQSADTAAVAAASKGADAELFSREMQLSAGSWRVLTCSDPALENPLLARMTEFWFNHLNVFTGKNVVKPFVGHYIVNVIRANALGKFEDLLLASAHHPAMLYYLDQTQSTVRGLNENYARELMELHTLGVGSGYTQTDVRELARILTGWSAGLNEGEGFRFNDRAHDKTGKVLLGQTIRANGEQEGIDAIALLARQPATAQRIARRLATTFVADKPPAALVARLADTFTATQGDIKAVMRVLVDSPEFWRADNQLFKTPLDFACSALTAAGGVGTGRRELRPVFDFLNGAGMPLHGWQTPDGYSTDAATWLAPEALTRRADFALALGTRINEPLFLLPFLSPASRDRIAREAPATRAGLMLASPDFMRK